MSTEYDTRINLAIASDDLPDAFAVSIRQFNQLMEAGKLADLTDAYNTYAIEALRNTYECDMETFNLGIVNGRTHGLSYMHSGFINSFGMTFIRKDWRESLGLNAPKTIQELEDMALMFMDNYGGYGIAEDQQLTSLLFMAPAFNAYNAWIQGSDGSIVYGLTQPEMKEAVALWADWYSKGIISNDFAATDHNKLISDIVSGQTGIHTTYSWAGWYPGHDVFKNQGTWLEPFPLPSVTGADTIHAIEFVESPLIVVNASFNNPEAIIKIMNLFVDVNYDVSGNYGMDTDAYNTFVAENRWQSTLFYAKRE